jgi:CheY-like chemotaxis protein
VLVVDDDVDSAEMLRMLLGLMGHEAAIAHDGRAALAVAGEHRPHAILLDISLPDIDGYEVARQIRLRYGHTMRLIALTGWGLDEDRQRAKDAGFDHFLTKPAPPDALERLLNEVVV